jgi:predicted DNA-binding transcriptional regulator AlpA
LANLTVRCWDSFVAVSFEPSKHAEVLKMVRTTDVTFPIPLSSATNPGQPIVASPNQAMTALGIGRAKLYEKINAGELESYVDGGSRKILWDSIRAFINRQLAVEAARRGNAA